MLYYASGHDLLTPQELAQRQPSSALESLAQPTPFDPSTSDVGTGADYAVAFTPIGLGLPLTILIHEVYTGRHPRAGLFRAVADMLVTSSIKSISTFDAQPLALNLLERAVQAKSRVRRAGASRQGTSLVYYSPSVIDVSLTLDLSIVFDQFPAEFFESAGGLMIAAAGIPLFFAQSSYLLGAGALTKLVGKAAEKLFDGTPAFRVSEPLDIQLAGNVPLAAGFLLLTDGHLDLEFRQTYRVNQRGRVVDSRGAEYQGDIPFIVLSIDGAPHQEFAAFAPTAASSVILSRFLGVQEGDQQSVHTAIEAISLYSDFKFRQQLDQLDRQIAATPIGNQDSLRKRREAIAANITNDLFKSPTPSS